MPFKEYFSGKRVLITGTGQGLGRALAKRLNNYGATVYALSKTAARLETLKTECPNIITICVDLSDWDATREAISKIGPVDHLVNNAISADMGSFFDVTSEAFDRIMSVGLKSFINVSQVVSKAMIEAEIKGSIVNISAVASTHPEPSVCVYSMMKAGVNMLTKLMALELGKHGIRVNAIKFGGIETEALKFFFDDTAKQLSVDPASLRADLDEKTPLSEGFVMSMDAAVNSVLYPLSNISSHLHGECVMVDGGYSLT